MVENRIFDGGFIASIWTGVFEDSSYEILCNKCLKPTSSYKDDFDNKVIYCNKCKEKPKEAIQVGTVTI